MCGSLKRSTRFRGHKLGDGIRPRGAVESGFSGTTKGIMSSTYTESLNKLIEEFERLPGVGPKTAERLAFYILKAQPAEAMKLAEAIADVKNKIKRCEICYNLAEQAVCQICSDERRDKSLICVVEQPKDIISLEKTGACKWVYHVLGGHIAPLEGVEPGDLTIEELVERVRKGDVKEVIMATNPNMAGDGTALYISSLLRTSGVRITRLARGIPTGSTIEYASGRILTDAIIGRQELE
jgi:recombination protein RecR